MAYKSIKEITDEHAHKGPKVQDAIKHVYSTYMTKYSLDHAGHLIAVVDEEWDVLAKHIRAAEHSEAIAHAGKAFKNKAGFAWVGVLSVDLIIYLLNAHRGKKPD